tara:strand:+ start:33 stop:551 length:519 start_codon:yes stop_codon:yes gene_type:complete
MEKRINKKIDGHFKDFKDDIKNKIDSISHNLSEVELSELLQYIYDYEKITLTNEDFVKRKRIKNEVPVVNRCCALRANKEQCTRRRRKNSDFCGTHIKGSPHGILDSSEEEIPVKQKIEVWIEEIRGIHYYLDANGNVYCPQDISKNIESPKIIATYEKQGGIYTIPGLGIN